MKFKITNNLLKSSIEKEASDDFIRLRSKTCSDVPQESCNLCPAFKTNSCFYNSPCSSKTEITFILIPEMLPNDFFNLSIESRLFWNGKERSIKALRNDSPVNGKDFLVSFENGGIFDWETICSTGGRLITSKESISNLFLQEDDFYKLHIKDTISWKGSEYIISSLRKQEYLGIEECVMSFFEINHLLKWEDIYKDCYLK